MFILQGHPLLRRNTVSNILALTDNTHYLVVTVSEVYNEDKGKNEIKFQVCALPWAEDEVVFDADVVSGEQNYSDDFKSAERVANYLNNGMRTRRYTEEYLETICTDRAALFATNCMDRLVETDGVKYRYNKAVIARNVKDTMIASGYQRTDFHLAACVNVIREQTERVLSLI